MDDVRPLAADEPQKRAGEAQRASAAQVQHFEAMAERLLLNRPARPERGDRDAMPQRRKAARQRDQLALGPAADATPPRQK